MRVLFMAILALTLTPCYSFNLYPPPIQTLQQVPEQSSISPSRMPSEAELLSSLTVSQTAQGTSSKSPKREETKRSSNSADVNLFISNIRYDGKVAQTEADEYVVLTNKANKALDISGYYIYVATSGTQGATYTFPKGSLIPPSKSIRIYTNEIHKESGGYSFGSKKAIWNNRGGLAVLRDANDKKLGEFKYKPSA